MKRPTMLILLFIFAFTAPIPEIVAAELAALDYFQIQQLVAKYARAIDTCSNNGYDYADLFTADGFFAPAMKGKVDLKFQGREKLAEVSGGGAQGCEKRTLDQRRRPAYLRKPYHHRRGGRGCRNGGYANDRFGRRSQQD